LTERYQKLAEINQWSKLGELQFTLAEASQQIKN